MDFNKWCWAYGYSHAKERSWIPTLHYIQNNSKQIKGLNIRAKTIKLLEENINVKLRDIGFNDINDFLDLTPKAQVKKKKIR